MTEHKKRIFGKVLATVALASLLGLTVYYSAPADRTVNFSAGPQPKPAFGFTWSLGEQAQTDPDYTNQTLVTYFFQMIFTLRNGTQIYLGLNDPRTSTLIGYDPDYEGNLAEVQKDMRVMLWHMWHEGNIGNANISKLETVTVHASLTTSDEVKDMGMYTFILGDSIFDANSSLYWTELRNGKPTVTNSPRWYDNSTDLVTQLGGCASGVLKFDAAISLYVNYNVTVGGEAQHGEKYLAWAGTIATVEIKSDGTNITEVAYDSAGITLLLLTLQQQTQENGT